ncbi:MAG: hypothetical protein KDG50_07110 [Chromatiales bacterium]|nr:hypothetical protein [Chromatiales bacterium]
MGTKDSNQAKHIVDSRTFISVFAMAILTYFTEEHGLLVELLGEKAASKVAIIIGAIAVGWRAVTTQRISMSAPITFLGLRKPRDRQRGSAVWQILAVIVLIAIVVTLIEVEAVRFFLRSLIWLPI